jgi:HK97 family phage portal protein
MAIAAPFRRVLQRFTGKSLESGTSGVEGQPKAGPWLITTGENQGWLPAEWGYWNFWQMDLDPLAAGGSAIVEACVAAYAQTIAMCPGDHWRALPNGGRERVTNSALSRILRRPNDYQSRSDFILKLAADLYRDGNTYALAVRNDRFEVAALHPFDPKQSRPLVAPGGEVFYELAGNNVIERQYGGSADRSRFLGLTRSGTSIIAPARDVLHVKLEACRGEPLVGVPPVRHAASAIAAQRAIGSQLVKTFGNMSRPAGVIETDVAVTTTQTKEFGQRFNEAWHGVDNLAGRPPILPPGMKFKGVSMTAQEADVAATIKLTQDEIFMVYGVPPAILGMTDKASFASTEALMQFWLARGLGFAINHIEVAFDHLFGLRSWPDEWVEFDTAALLRVAYKDRIEALARGVQGGIYAPNEARNAEDLPDAPFGDEPRVQQQVVPLSAWDKAKPETPRPDAPPAQPPAAGAEEKPEAQEEEPEQAKAAKFDERAFELGETEHVTSRAA